MLSLYLATITITLTLAVEQLICDTTQHGITQNCRAGQTLTANCGLCDPTQGLLQMESIRQCFEAHHRFPRFNGLRLALVKTTRDAIRPPVCGGNDGFTCRYAFLCDLGIIHYQYPYITI